MLVGQPAPKSIVDAFVAEDKRSCNLNTIASFSRSAPREPLTFWYPQSCVLVFAFECARLACECAFFVSSECAFDCMICIQDGSSKQ